MTKIAPSDADSMSEASAGAPIGSAASASADVVIRPGKAELDPVGYRRRRRTIEIALSWAVPVLALVVWQAAASLGWIDRRFFPAPTDVLREGRKLIANGNLQKHVWASLWRILVGMFIGVLSGVIVGVVLGVSRYFRAAFDPLLSALYTVPKLALLPMLLLLLGLGEGPKIALVAITVFFFMWIATMEAVSSGEEHYREAARSFGCSRWQILRYVIIPSATPQVMVGVRISTGIAVLTVVAAEMLQGDDGLGFLIWHSWSLFKADQMYVGIIASAVLGLVLSLVVQIVSRLSAPWSPQSRRLQG